MIEILKVQEDRKDIFSSLTSGPQAGQADLGPSPAGKIRQSFRRINFAFKGDESGEMLLRQGPGHHRAAQVRGEQEDQVSELEVVEVRHLRGRGPRGQGERDGVRGRVGGDQQPDDAAEVFANQVTRKLEGRTKSGCI